MARRAEIVEAPIVLSTLLASAADGQVPVVPFSARVSGRRVVVTAVLERTAVVADHPRAHRRLVRLADVSVRPSGVAWGPPPLNDEWAARARIGRLQSARSRRHAKQAKRTANGKFGH